MHSDTAQRQAARVVGILAGGGDLPREIADSLVARGVKPVVVAIDGEADGSFAGMAVTRLGWGKVGRMLATFRNAGARDIVIVGKVRRPDLKTFRPDAGFLLGLPEIVRLIAGGGGDDRVLRGIIGFFERRGFRVVGIEQVAPHLVVAKGLLTAAPASAADVADMALASGLLAALAPFDIGQAAVASQGRIEAVEAVENTDAMLARVAARRRAEGRTQRAGVLVKLTKRGQERRIDLPAIGPATMTAVAAANLVGIGVEVGGVVAVRREETIARADAAGLFIAGIDALGTAPAAAARAAVSASDWRVLGGGGCDAALAADAAVGACVQAAAEPFLVGRAIIVSRRHVLAVEAGEGIDVMLAHAAGLRQWGMRGSRRRAGVLVLAHRSALSKVIAKLAADAGLAAIAVVDVGAADPLPASIIGESAARIPILARQPAAGEGASREGA